MFAICVDRKVSGVGSAAWVCSIVDVHGEVMLWVAVTDLLLSMANVVCLVQRSCGVHEQS